jgi:hypothetical protein
VSGVVLRCPNCGTSRSTPGECDACHEGEVRYFCTNHTPGLWLDGKACTRCGARFGQAAPAAPAGPAAPSRPAARAPRAAPVAPPPRRPTEEVFGRLEEPPPARAPTLDDILAAAARAREAGRPPMGAPDPAAAARGLGGCLVRAVLLLFLFVLMIFSGMFLFAGSMFRVW